MSATGRTHERPDSVFAVLILLLAGCIVGALMGAAYAFVMNWIPVRFCRILATISLGVGVGTAVGQIGRRTSIRTSRSAVLCACSAGLVGVYAAWVFDGMARFGVNTFPRLLLTIGDIRGYMIALEQGVWTRSGFPGTTAATTASGLVWLFIWVCEIGIVLFCAAWFAADIRRHRYLRSLLVFRTELPLLRRELTELSNRKRTYIVRVIGACVLLFFVFLSYREAMIAREQLISAFGGFVGPTTYLGIGGAVFAAITPMLFYTIQLLMPALCCSSVTAEKENNTIGTLLLTKLSPGTIILEKVGSRVVPMLTILILAFPVLAHVHSLGGVDTDQLFGTIWLLLTECFLIASVSILFSSWFSTTTTAFVWSYAFIAFMLVLSMSLEMTTFLPSAIWEQAFAGSDRYASAAQTAMLKRMGMAPPAAAAFSGWKDVFRESFFAWMVIGLFLLLARLCVVRRAFVSQASVLLKAFQLVDRFFKSLNQATTGGIEIVKDSNPLPDNDPVAWRERTKKSLGKARYLFRILIALEVPTLFICLFAATVSARSAFTGLFVLQCLVWTLVGLIAAVKSATLFSSERAKETIEPLLASPMTGREILQQKITGIRRLLLVLSVPVLTVNLTHFLLHANFNANSNNLGQWGLVAVTLIPGIAGAIGIMWLVVRNPRKIGQTSSFLFFVGGASVCGVLLSLVLLLIDSGPEATSVKYLVLSCTTATILLYLIVWVTTGIGLFIHSQTKAVIVAVGVLATWIVLPVVIAGVFGPNSRELVVSLSPYSLVEANERFLTGQMLFGSSWDYTDHLGKFWWVATHTTFSFLILVLWLVIRALTPHLLNRREKKSVPFAGMPASRIAVLEGSR